MSENLESERRTKNAHTKKTTPKQNKNNIKTQYGRADKGKSNFPSNIKRWKYPHVFHV